MWTVYSFCFGIVLTHIFSTLDWLFHSVFHFICPTWHLKIDGFASFMSDTHVELLIPDLFGDLLTTFPQWLQFWIPPMLYDSNRKPVDLHIFLLKMLHWALIPAACCLAASCGFTTLHSDISEPLWSNRGFPSVDSCSWGSHFVWTPEPVLVLNSPHSACRLLFPFLPTVAFMYEYTGAGVKGVAVNPSAFMRGRSPPAQLWRRLGGNESA